MDDALAEQCPHFQLPRTIRGKRQITKTEQVVSGPKSFPCVHTLPMRRVKPLIKKVNLMARITSLRAQHDAVEAMTDQIFTDIEHYRSDKDAYPLSLKLARLAGILRTHFALEDEILYPSMIESDHREAAVMARVFRTEHANLASQFERFIGRWSKSTAIAASLRQFEFEAGMLFAALRERIDRENRELYPLAEQALAMRDLPLRLDVMPEPSRLPA